MRQTGWMLAAALVLAGGAGQPAVAQENTPAAGARREAGARKQARAVRVEGRPPAIDGRLDEAAWAQATPISDFVQKLPTEGAAPTADTEVRFLYDAAYVYVGARMRAAAEGIRAPITRRDNGILAEFIRVSFDTYQDRRTAYSFGITAAGARLDGYHSTDSEAQDVRYDPVWEARVARDPGGWTAEMRIPLSQLRFIARPEQTWGLNVNRWIPSREEDLYWSLVPASESGWASRFGDLAGLSGVRPVRRVELMPYVASGATLRSGVHPADPLTSPREAAFRTGGDLKAGLGSNVTLDVTVNPDFGQVDADPAEVNLSVFETFFPERRPFFTEGSQLLSGGGASYFYSRRIGAPPRGPAGGDFVRRPDDSTILGAAKLTGQLPSGLSLGVLAAVTDRERARTYDSATSVFGRVEVEPRTGYAVARAQQQLGSSGSTVGATLTAVSRDLEPGSPLALRVPGQAFAGGVDWNLRFGRGAYQVGGHVGASRVAGDSVAILRLQRSSARYYQRPDADYVEADPSRTDLAGYTASLNAARISGEHWLWTAGAALSSPGLELNDAGRLSVADAVSAFAELRYRETKPRGPFRSYDVFVTPEVGWNYGGTRTGGTLWLDAVGTWQNRWRSDFTAFYTPRAQSVTASRGGPRAGTRASWAVINRLASSSAARFRWNGRVYYGENEDGRATYRLSGGVAFRPGPRWQLSVDPNFLQSTPTRQYVATLDGGPAATGGKRYVFASVGRSEFFAQVRLNYLFTPDLSMEFYAEPFASSGRYHTFGELPAPGSHELTLYGTDTTRVRREGNATRVLGPGGGAVVQDFNVRSFRSNAVLRWEWRPGSSLFVVWQQDRAGDRDEIAPVGFGSLAQTLDAPGDHRLAIKVSYWLPLR
ncbi:DUF5916 domain-containing protein [Longimicrobium sp.]|uniref:DUF5916 domain-containing protein n=1 Tax=Longimicrobium sp. TaxID=2029185 RepID=UPI002ED8A348